MMKMVIPREHGGWAMVLVPYLSGVILSNPSLYHIPLFFGWLSFYLATWPMRLIWKSPKQRELNMPWLWIYLAAGVILSLPALIRFPELIALAPILIVAALVNIWYAIRRNERSLVNDFVAIFALCLGSVGALMVGGSEDLVKYGLVWLFSVLYFASSVFYVKPLFRERNNRSFKTLGNILNGFILIIPAVFGLWPLIFVYLPSTLKSWLTPYGARLKPMQIGMIEIGNSAWFLLSFSFVFLAFY